ncbi:substrate-binding domain-containing protein [Agrobacterium tumefaciens]|uniref:LacI family DNA-binding transcriptional regulator n=1 Tax=Agrobacterium tumefaciens TaxID=358 RepID=UPI001571E8BB|nr:LacI family DNA-binding transcriptional regulator [Agrobacterium tumefaciens]NTE56743.1 substrate-binding domain-containing protein [Agrobacterium tumefaciens]NTE71938.1 substrate-binding domain-containing protein [Agrobacterium tumefaciens]
MASKRQGRRVTITDVAERAGVGTASVDRVLNDRGNVSEAVSKRVLQAAKELGLRRMLPQAHRRLIRIDVILARPELPLIARMGFEFLRIATSLDRSIVIHRTVLKDERPETLAKALAKTGCDAVVSYMRDHPLVHAAVEELSARGIPVVTVISDVPGSARIGYAGTDHYRAGRSAGYFISRMARKPGPVILLCNHLGFQSHADRVRGVTQFLAEKAPGWHVARIVEGGDDRARSELQLREAFHAEPDTVAVYNVGAANIGVARAIRADILPDRPAFVGHELTRNTAAFLREGLMSLTIDQSPELQVRLAVNILLRHFEFFDAGQGSFPPETEVPIVLYGPENLPNPLPF